MNVATVRRGSFSGRARPGARPKGPPQNDHALDFAPHAVMAILIAAFVLSALGRGTIFAQEHGLTAEIASLGRPIRAGAPLVVDWNISSPGPELLEGGLEVIVSDGQQVLSRCRIDDLVLMAGDQTLRTTLPTLSFQNMSRQVRLHLSFVSGNQRIDLDAHPLPVPVSWQRSFVVGVCDPWHSSLSRSQQQLVSALHLERFDPHPDGSRVATLRVRMQPDEMSANPLGYCRFDLVLLTQAAFADLRRRQLDALHDWVQAGGSLCVLPGGALDPYHVRFLNGLTAFSGGDSRGAPGDQSSDDARRPQNSKPRPAGATYLLDANGQFATAGEADTDTMQLLRCGLGRAVIVPPNAMDTDDFDSVTWREAAAFLWKVRREQQERVVSTGQWDETLLRRNEPDVRGVRPRRSTSVGSLFSIRPIQTGGGLRSKLMPESIRVIPLELIGFLLFLYLLAIGPGDYFLLGFFRQRKLTWVLFPAVTVAFTLFTVWLAQTYMATDNRRRAVTFLDIGEEGTIVRENRYELLFTGTRRTMETPVRSAILTPLNLQLFDTRYRFRRRPSRRDDLSLGVPVYDGRIPTRYRVVQDIPQWTPQVNRLFAVAPQREPPDFDWFVVTRISESEDRLKAVTTSLESRDHRSRLTERILQTFGTDASAYLLHGRKVIRLTGDSSLFPERTVYRRNSAVVVRRTGPEGRVSDFLRDVCVRPESGLFSIVSQVSPTGGDNFEDLALLDPSDPSQWLLVVAVERGDEVLIYRKLYTGEN